MVGSRTGGWPTHLYLGVLAVVVSAAGLAAVFYVRESSVREAERVVDRSTRFTADLAASEIRASLDDLASTTAALAATPNLPHMLEHPQGCSLNFSGVGVFPEGHLDILNRTGEVVCSSVVAVEAGAGYASADWFRGASTDAVLQAPVEDPASGEPALVQAVPTASGLVVAAFVELAAVGPALSRQLSGPQDYEFLVLDAEGERIISTSVQPQRWTDVAIAGPPWPRTVATFERPGVDGTRRFYGRSRVPDLGWNVYSGADRAGVLAPANKLFRATALIIALGVLLTLLTLWLIWKLVARPIRSLRTSVRDATQDPSSASIAVFGPSEVVGLANDFKILLDSMARELTERRRAEDALSASERQYRLLFEKNPQPMWIYDADNLSFLEVNDAACRHYGYPRDRWFDMTIKDIRPPDDVPALLESARNTEPVDRSGPWRHVRADGSIIEVDITSHKIDFRDRRGRFVIADDVTERRRIERQLQQSQRLDSLGQLAGGVAHDFNNLLGVILSYATFVKETLVKRRSDEMIRAAEEDIDQVTAAAQRAASLTRRLLTFARQDVARPEVVDPNEGVEEVAKMLTRTIGEEIDFKTELASDIWLVQIDPTQLQQVLLNLAVNARDAMPSGGSLRIQVSNVEVDEEDASAWTDLKPGRFVRIRVSDTGVGMEPEVAERVFEPFFTTKGSGEGTGLGLATVHGIVKQAGGSIHLYSEPGIGTSVSVWLPATDRPVSDRKDEPVPSVGGNERVLVVEDEDSMRELLRRTLTRRGYHVVLASSGQEAIALAQDPTLQIDLVITDVVMPGMLGREITERMGALRPGTPIIYMSGYARSMLDSQGRLEGGRIFIEKPFSEAELLRVVREALE